MPFARKAAAIDRFNEIASVRIELLGSDPPIWRQVELPTSISLKVLHDIIQIVMGWQDCHLWEFTIARQLYGPPMQDDWGSTPRIAATKILLRDVLQPRRTTIDYLYDFGDSWELRLTVTNIGAGEPGVSYPRYVAGEQSAPPEDCGGIPGFYAMLDVVADPGHPDHAHIKEWLGDYDPDGFDPLPISFALGRIANRRRAGRTRYPKIEKPGT